MTVYLCSAKTLNRIINPDQCDCVKQNTEVFTSIVQPHIPGFFSKDEKATRILLMLEQLLNIYDNETSQKIKQILKDNI